MSEMLAKPPVADAEAPPPMRRVSGASIIRIVAKEFGVTAEMILGDRRRIACVRPRQVAAWIMVKRGFSMPHAGRRLGLDHTTVLHAVRRIDALMAADADLASKVHRVLDKVREASLRPWPEMRFVAAAPPMPAPKRQGTLTVSAYEEFRKLRRAGWSKRGLAKRYDLSDSMAGFLADGVAPGV